MPRLLATTVGLALALGGLYAGGALAGFDPTTSSRDAVDNLLHDFVPLPPLDPEVPGPTAAPTPDADGRQDPSPESYAERYRRLLREQPSRREARDFSFMDKVAEAPVHWSCTAQIPVRLTGDVPAGAEGALDEVVAALGAASKLQLRVERDHEPGPPGAGVITVYYASAGEQPGSFSAEEGVLGRGGPRYWRSGPSAGFIQTGEVVVRDDVPLTDPQTGIGKLVLAHEIMHALGVGHSEPDLPELMTPAAQFDVWPTIGPGDQLALRVVGCDA